MPHFGRIGAGARREQEGLANRLDGQCDDDLVGDLGRLAVAVAADQCDVLAHQIEERFDLGEGALGSADHDRQGRRLGADLAAGDRRVEIVAPLLVDLRGEELGLDRRDRAHIDDDLPR